MNLIMWKFLFALNVSLEHTFSKDLSLLGLIVAF